MEPPRRCREMVWGVSPHPNSPTPTRRQVQHHPPLPTPRYPHLTHTAEDALEGLYFVDRRILRCLPYFFRKTRPRASYELLEAFSPSCGGVWGHLGRLEGTIPHLPLPTPRHPHLTHIDEDALEGVYFAFSTILRCLPYFFRKTRPVSSYELLEAFSPSWGRCGASPNPNTRAHGSLES